MFVYGIAQEGDVCLLGLIRCTCETNQIVNLDKNSSAPIGSLKLMVYWQLHSTVLATNRYGLNFVDLYPIFCVRPNAIIPLWLFLVLTGPTFQTISTVHPGDWLSQGS